ncbi:MAG: hypothetical protein M9950_06570 [Thermomicrobiales bacterium]|nr:hypothetical protein [Thermomicrobiales bacterium]
MARVPRNHGRNVTCVALAMTGITQSLVFEDALDGPIFAQWIQERLLPALAPGTSIVFGQSQRPSECSGAHCRRGSPVSLRFPATLFTGLQSD